MKIRSDKDQIDIFTLYQRTGLLPFCARGRGGGGREVEGGEGVGAVGAVGGGGAVGAGRHRDTPSPT